MAANEPNEGKNRTWKLFSAALLFAVLAGLGTILYLKILEHRLEKRLTPPEKEMVSVVVASGDLATGTKVDTATMAVRKVPAEFVNSDVVTPDRFDSIQGAVLVKPLEHGKMLTQDYIDLNIPKDFSGTIQSGHRAMTIQVDEVNSISGMIRPGNAIDLFTRIQSGAVAAPGASSEGEVVIPVLEDVLVLATDNSSARPNEDEFESTAPEGKQRVYNTLTLEVTPREAALIAVAESRGSLIATLRNANDTGGALFNKVGLADLFSHSGELLKDAVNKQQNRSLDTVHIDKDGHLVTKDGTVITDPNVYLNKDGLLVNKDGTVLSGRDLEVGADGKIRTKDGKAVDTATLINGQGGTLVDKNGTVLDSNGYNTAKGGFLVDSKGNVMTHDGTVLSGVSVGKDGMVKTADGRVLTADQITVGKDGKVRIAGDVAAGMTVDKNGDIRAADGSPARAADLVTVGADGVVRTKDGTVLRGVTMDKDGNLVAADGKKMSAADVMLASQGLTRNSDGTVTATDGKIYAAKDLVTVDKDGVVRTKDGTVLDGVQVNKDGNLVDRDGKVLTAAEIAARGEIGKAADKAADDLIASQGLTLNSDGTVTDASGKVLAAKDLITIGTDGKIRTKDGTVLDGVSVDKDGNLRNRDGVLITARDVLKADAVAKATAGSGEILAGVTGVHDPNFVQTLGQDEPGQRNAYTPYEVEYIIGGGSDGAAKTFKVQVDSGDPSSTPNQQQQELKP